jgi:hypothetical protein
MLPPPGGQERGDCGRVDAILPFLSCWASLFPFCPDLLFPSGDRLVQLLLFPLPLVGLSLPPPYFICNFFDKASHKGDPFPDQTEEVGEVVPFRLRKVTPFLALLSSYPVEFSPSFPFTLKKKVCVMRTNGTAFALTFFYLHAWLALVFLQCSANLYKQLSHDNQKTNPSIRIIEPIQRKTYPDQLEIPARFSVSGLATEYRNSILITLFLNGVAHNFWEDGPEDRKVTTAIL